MGWPISRPSKIRSVSSAKRWVSPSTSFRPRFTRVVPVVSQPFVISWTNFPSLLLRFSQGFLLWSLSAMWIRDFKHRLVSLLIWPRIRGSSASWRLFAFCTSLERMPIFEWRTSVFVHSRRDRSNRTLRPRSSGTFISEKNGTTTSTWSRSQRISSF